VPDLTWTQKLLNIFSFNIEYIFIQYCNEKFYPMFHMHHMKHKRNSQITTKCLENISLFFVKV